ncbi:MAG: hypothetical protein JO199_13115 [Candidatus Eremiobacteraeota bacterium]|nr:hypothetical protein [Candidatus Eremiobacteraeota bacterium]
MGSCWLATTDSAGHHGSVPLILCRGAGETSPSPTPSPGGAPVTESPASVQMCPHAGADKCKNDEARSTIAQNGSNGSFTLSTTCPSNVATIARSSVSGDTATYTISGVSTTGNCTATFTGVGGVQATLTITVTAGGIGIN